MLNVWIWVIGEISKFISGYSFDIWDFLFVEVIRIIIGVRKIGCGCVGVYELSTFVLDNVVENISGFGF